MATGKITSPDACMVLTHPAFDRPPVRNERRRGPKPGTESIASARRRREWAAIDATRRELPGASPYDVADGLLHSSPLRVGSDRAACLSRDDGVIAEALALLDSRLRRPGEVFDSPGTVKQFVTLHLAELPREEFKVLFLTHHHALLAFEGFGSGSLSQVSVFPREVVRRALALNAGAVILAHNHPSGLPEPSRADEMLTQSMKAALALVEVRVLDHLVVGRLQVVSFAERGLL